MTILESINSPRDLDALTPGQLDQLAEEIRDFLVQKVSRTGGHLGPNLGVVELTLALHRVFDSPTDAILFDTGHQTYVHKMVTGRQAGFDELRKAGGLSGYPSRAESEHDWIENSHASTALSYADGLAKAWELSGELGSRRVVAVVGDGSLTGGMAWEALNNIADSERQVIIVANDNARSYAPTVGGLARHLEVLRATDGYERFLEWGKRVLGKTPVVGRPAYETLHGLKKGVKDVIAPQGMFEDLGLKYIGPVDGHNRDELERALRLAKEFHGPVIVHTITQKGHGYAPAERDDADHFHGVGVIDPDTGKAVAASPRTWTSVFADELVAIGDQRQDVVAITAAMLAPTGLTRFAERFPTRTFDVGIAEQHAATSAAGLAMGGLHPVVAVYATFLNRAFDQVLLDCALHRLGVTFVLDRAGITGDDGASHNGMWDMTILQAVPGLRLAAPRDEGTLRAALREAVGCDHAVTVVRFAKGAVPDDVPVLRRVGAVDVLAEARSGAADSVLVVPVGSMVSVGLELAARLTGEGVDVTVAAPVWVKPVPVELADLAADHSLVVTIEDNGQTGGVGATISQALRAEGVFTPLREFGIEQDFIEQGSRAQVLERVGLTAEDIHRTVAAQLARQSAELDAT